MTPTSIIHATIYFYCYSVENINYKRSGYIVILLQDKNYSLVKTKKSWNLTVSLICKNPMFTFLTDPSIRFHLYLCKNTINDNHNIEYFSIRKLLNQEEYDLLTEMDPVYGLDDYSPIVPNKGLYPPMRLNLIIDPNSTSYICLFPTFHGGGVNPLNV